MMAVVMRFLQHEQVPSLCRSACCCEVRQDSFPHGVFPNAATVTAYTVYMRPTRTQ